MRNFSLSSLSSKGFFVGLEFLCSVLFRSARFDVPRRESFVFVGYFSAVDSNNLVSVPLL